MYESIALLNCAKNVYKAHLYWQYSAGGVCLRPLSLTAKQKVSAKQLDQFRFRGNCPPTPPVS